MDIGKQIGYWKSTALNDIGTAEVLINNHRYVEGLFFCHLSVEKMLKAIVVKATSAPPPKSHKLLYLTELASISITAEQSKTMAALMKFQIEGRYPEYFPEPPLPYETNELFIQTMNLLECLKEML